MLRPGWERPFCARGFLPRCPRGLARRPRRAAGYGDPSTAGLAAPARDARTRRRNRLDRAPRIPSPPRLALAGRPVHPRAPSHRLDALLIPGRVAFPGSAGVLAGLSGAIGGTPAIVSAPATRPGLRPMSWGCRRDASAPREAPPARTSECRARLTCRDG